MSLLSPVSIWYFSILSKNKDLFAQETFTTFPVGDVYSSSIITFSVSVSPIYNTETPWQVSVLVSKTAFCLVSLEMCDYHMKNLDVYHVNFLSKTLLLLNQGGVLWQFVHLLLLQITKTIYQSLFIYTLCAPPSQRHIWKQEPPHFSLLQIKHLLVASYCLKALWD